MCPQCLFVRDTGGFGDGAPAPRHRFGDAVILGDLGGDVSDVMGEDTGSFLTVATGEHQRIVVPAPAYIGASTSTQLRPESVFVRSADVATRVDVLTPIERHVLDLIDGARPMARVRVVAGLESGDLRIVLALLIDKHMIELAGRVQAPGFDELVGDSNEAPAVALFDDDDPTMMVDFLEPCAPAVAPATEPIRPAMLATFGLPPRSSSSITAPQTPPPPPPAAAVSKRAEHPRAATFLRMARVDLQSGNVVRGNAYLRLALSLDPDSVDAQEMQRDFGAAVSAARTPRLSEDERLIVEAKKAEEAGDYERCIALLQKAIDRSSVKAPLYNQLGVVLATRMKRYGDSVTAIARAIDLAPDNATYKNNLGKVAAAAEVSDVKTDPSLLRRLFGARKG